MIWAFADMSVAGRACITYINPMRPSFPIRWSAALVGLLWLLALPAQAGPLADAIDEINADVLFLRHALAPGFGDPANFSIHDCGTQRNLSRAGREQSRRIGQYLRDCLLYTSDAADE